MCQNHIAELINIPRSHSFFVGIDSDGCVFDTMELKQKACFHNTFIERWGLQEIEQETRETQEFVSLYSIHRGMNRFNALLLVADLLSRRPEIIKSGVCIPTFADLKALAASGEILSQQRIEEEAEQRHSQELWDILSWSREVNRLVSERLKTVEVFPWVTQSLEKMHKAADLMVVSATPVKTLLREWEGAGLKKYVNFIAGQEHGKKEDHLRFSAMERYEKDHVLLLGDSPGDLNAAKTVGALFYPINPGHEVASWQRFYEEVYERFISREYEGSCQDQAIEEFLALLPAKPAWISEARPSE